MRLKNKKTGEIRNAVDIDMHTDSVYLKVSDGEFDNETIEYRSLAELNEEWGDYEEPKGMQWVDVLGANDGRVVIQYPNEKEAEKAVERLRAWKRLEDKGFRFVEWQKHGITEDFIMDGAVYFEDVKNADRKDLDICFGGEE